ncbi:MAG TPA: RNA-binding cell elongation regulator Jag/EloR [Acidimicrobiales bacterium]|nr:RNA-binding cell elongation regulator Jag/EloR [Acidimicrobiales bacterium]
MEWVETTGRTVEEAKKSALEQLGVEEADTDFEVISEPKVGLFGRLKEEARVRARVRPRYPRSKGERRERRRGRGPAGADHASQVGPVVPQATTTDQTRDGTDERKSRSKPDETEARAAGDVPAARRRRRSSPSAASGDKPERGGANFGEVNTASVEEQVALAEQFVRGLLVEMGAQATITSEELAEGVVELLITGENLGTLIGPKGATLLALQELTRTVMQRQVSSSECRIVLDINGYRRRRQDALARFARQVALEVQASNTKRALEPMPPPDRKVVHDAVNDVPGVKTISEGEEPYRRVLLIPVSPDSADNESSAAAGQEQSESFSS